MLTRRSALLLVRKCSPSPLDCSRTSQPYTHTLKRCAILPHTCGLIRGWLHRCCLQPPPGAAHLRVHTLLHKRLALAQQLAGQHDNCRGAVADLPGRGLERGQMTQSGRWTAGGGGEAWLTWRKVVLRSAAVSPLHTRTHTPPTHTCAQDTCPQAAFTTVRLDDHPPDPTPPVLLTSASCASEMSHRTLAAGCTISRSFMMVAPSLEIVTPCSRARPAQHSSWSWDLSWEKPKPVGWPLRCTNSNAHAHAILTRWS